jgi:hypothetical protein
MYTSNGDVTEQLEGFWSYTHRDNAAEGGRIVALADDVKAQYSLVTGDKLELFVDRDGIDWGEKWQEVINLRLQSGSFFIPIITPSYLKSNACRHEFETFLSNAQQNSLSELILPILYADVFELSDFEHDNIVQQVKQLQYKNWTALRFEEITSGPYRKAVAEIAEYLMNTGRRLELRDSPRNLTPGLTSKQGESDGILEKSAKFEEAIERLPNLAQEIVGQIRNIGGKTSSRGDEMNMPNQTFASRLALANLLAQELKPHSDDLYELCKEFSAGFYEIDSWLNAYIDFHIQVPGDSDEDYERLLGTFREVAQSVISEFDPVKEVITSMSSVEKISQRLKPVVRVIIAAFTMLTGVTEIAERWLKLDS